MSKKIYSDKYGRQKAWIKRNRKYLNQRNRLNTKRRWLIKLLAIQSGLLTPLVPKKYQPIPKIIKECLHCGQEFITNKRGKYCKASHRPSSRRAKKIRQRIENLRGNLVPKWEDKNKLYGFIKNKPRDMEIDHIIPLNHPNVCGLHCLSNLQYLTPEENRVKSNLFDFTQTNESWRLLTLK